MSLSRNSKKRKNILDNLFFAQSGKCYWCRGEMCKKTRQNDKVKPITATFDHRIPKAMGGADKSSNIVLACYQCNTHRGGILGPPQFTKKDYSLRPINPAGEQLLDLYFPVLDNGFISLKDYMGTDDCITNAARVSYGYGTKKKNTTAGLIRYLMRKEHMSPFEMAEVKFHIGMPIFVARQWVRHRMASLNEYSGRYSVMPTMFYTPPAFNKQSQTNKQGRSNIGGEFEEYYKWALKKNRKNNVELYTLMLADDVSRELARIDLPLTTYTYWYWKCDIRNLLHFIGLRSDPHAQYEIRVYSDIIAGMMQMMFPHTFAAFMDYHFLSTTMTIKEMELIKHIYTCNLNDHQIDRYMKSNGGWGDRETDEFKAKLRMKPVPNFNLDLSSAKTPEYFERLIAEYVIPEG